MKKLLLFLGVFASIVFTSSVSAALIYVNDNGFYHSNELSSEVQYDFEGANLSFTINNTSVIPSTITAFAFNATGTVENYEGSWYLWDDPITPPQKNKFGKDFDYGLSIFPSNWNGGNPSLGIKEGESQTFNFQVSDTFGLFDNDKGYSFIVRYQSVGFDGEGSDVGGSAVPIPGAALLLGSGMMGVLALRRRRLYSQ